ARRLITQKFSHIINVLYIAHRLNLICKDIMKESFSKRILSQAKLVAQFFKSSHIANSALENKIQINNIIGGGIKRYVATLNSRYMKTNHYIFKKILENDPDIISSNEVYTILNRGSFYDDLYFMTTILRPIKESIVQLESHGFKKGQYKKIVNYADVYDHLSTLAAKLLAITSHSASCERVFSTLGWIYRKKRTRLAFEKVKALAKIHRYYTTHAKEEISYINCELILEDVLAVTNEIEDFDLNHEAFGEKDQTDNVKLGSENIVEKEPNYDYNVDSLVDELFA
ncbi:16170_t:CDS:2, partial [Cetraspora pellucida]